MGQVVTFYSYKGGVGRTMALANIATLLAQWGYKTLLVDWDLEAPGLEFYFQEFIDVQTIAQQQGLVDLLERVEEVADGESLPESVNWKEVVVEIEIHNAKEKVHLITAGQRDQSSSYFDKVTKIDWGSFYRRKGGFFVERLRTEWKEQYDYVLVDSRTGITDIGGICTIQLPDVLVLMFTATEQSLNGIVEVAAEAQTAQWDLPFDRTSLTCLPIPSRFDSSEEFKISRQWLDRFSEDLKDIYDDWLPRSVKRERFLEVTKIPHYSYFSFGEKLPVIEQGTTDPAGLGYAYENIATVILDEFESVERLLKNRDELVAERSKPKSKLRIFISYARKDKLIVDKLYRRLQKEGYQLWAPEIDILAGQEWSTAVENAIDSSDVFIACVSENSIGSQFVKEEWSMAAVKRSSSKKSIYLVPVRLDDSNISNLQLGESSMNLRNVASLDLREEDGFERLLKSIEYVRIGRTKTS